MWGLNSRMFTTIDACIAEQLETFRRLYGHEPAHVDGHKHVHQALGVMLARSWPGGLKMRPSFTFMAGEKSLPNRLARALVNRAMRARFSSAQYLFDLREMHPALGGAGLEHKLGLADRHSVEVMTHPGVRDERDLLLGDDWPIRLRAHRVGAYADLNGR
jgi:predicted glycoside hydrolase/deacetylase ChbG (UPF0249 family)